MNTEVKIGQIWRDADPRMDYGRYGKLVEFDEKYAYLQPCDPWGRDLWEERRLRMLRKRLNGRSNGWILYKDIE